MSWTAQFPPDNYNFSFTCSRLCDNALTISSVQVVMDVGANNYTITDLDPGNNCSVIVTAMYGSNSTSLETETTNTTSESMYSILCNIFLSLNLLPLAPTGASGTLTNTSVESRSLTVVWGTVPCPDQRGPITGYRLRYSNGTSIVNTTGEGSRQHVLTGLTPFTSYSVQVAAVNAGGTGPYSDPALTVETMQDGE